MCRPDCPNCLTFINGRNPAARGVVFGFVLGIDHSLAERMQPNDSSAEFASFEKQLSVGDPQ